MEFMNAYSTPQAPRTRTSVWPNSEIRPDVAGHRYDAAAAAESDSRCDQAPVISACRSRELLITSIDRHELGLGAADALDFPALRTASCLPQQFGSRADRKHVCADLEADVALGVDLHRIEPRGLLLLVLDHLFRQFVVRQDKGWSLDGEEVTRCGHRLRGERGQRQHRCKQKKAEHKGLPTREFSIILSIWGPNGTNVGSLVPKRSPIEDSSLLHRKSLPACDLMATSSAWRLIVLGRDFGGPDGRA